MRTARIDPARIVAYALLAAVMLAWPLRAATPETSITPESELRFGSFALFSGSGWISVSPMGAVSQSGIVKVSSGDTGPARFTIAYDRGNNGRNRLDLTILLVISAPPVVQRGGVRGRLTALQTDLPGFTQLLPGQIAVVQISNCRTRICSRSFQVGGRLEVSSNGGGAVLAIPVPVDVTVVSIR